MRIIDCMDWKHSDNPSMVVVVRERHDGDFETEIAKSNLESVISNGIISLCVCVEINGRSMGDDNAIVALKNYESENPDCYAFVITGALG